MTRKVLLWTVPLAILVVAVASCAGWLYWPGGGIPSDAWSMLEEADEWELYSLFPDEQEKSLPERFHGYPVLGKTTVRDAGTRRLLCEALAQGARRRESLLPGAGCFFPRHGIHVSHGDKSADLVICFQCGHVYLYQGDLSGFGTTGSPQPAFDAVLADAGVPLAPSGCPPWKAPTIRQKSDKALGESK